ncbi:cation transporter [Microbacterium sp. LRZ72]|uniref:heavy-metal-associated domain-containing protein n=1 Tax=Microbacterium sp. LRZ72 TaxID=2942481 RepID=UPI0029ADB006|nr:cation transporter [Microbacterium sp. LRZ72]MDX2376868.1 cation transporter [Microbacterium sp. LRZ72]
MTGGNDGVVETIAVTGMTCDHCVRSVTEELAAIEGVQGVAVDLVAGGVSRVEVRSGTPLDPAVVDAALDEAGYARAPGDAP